MRPILGRADKAMSRKVSITPPGADYVIHVLGDRSRTWRDFYHWLLQLTWPRTFGVIAVGFLVANALFAVSFHLVGGIANARPGSFADAFYFSVQTMGTIGYGAMYPQSTAANALVVVESIVSLVITALATGLVFAKFSRPSARILFSRQAVVAPMNGVPTLSFRVGNQRGNRIVDGELRAVVSRAETTQEGVKMFRLLDVKLVRQHTLSLSRSLTVMHVIDEHSPFHGHDARSAADQDFELSVMLVGLDDTSMHTVHASHLYYARDIRWNTRHVDILSEGADGSLVLDLNKFHDIEEL